MDCCFYYIIINALSERNWIWLWNAYVSILRCSRKAPSEQDLEIHGGLPSVPCLAWGRAHGANAAFLGGTRGPQVFAMG